MFAFEFVSMSRLIGASEVGKFDVKNLIMSTFVSKVIDSFVVTVCSAGCKGKGGTDDHHSGENDGLTQ